MARKRKRKLGPNERYQNQQMIYIHKYIGHTKDYYFNMDLLKTQEAMRKLSHVTFKLYVYLCQISNGHTMLSSAHKFSELTGVSLRTYYIAKQELIDNYYLVPREDGDFDFYNYPNKPLTHKDIVLNGILDKIREENALEENL